jgi:hypothetical protein
MKDLQIIPALMAYLKQRSLELGGYLFFKEELISIVIDLLAHTVDTNK